MQDIYGLPSYRAKMAPANILRPRWTAARNGNAGKRDQEQSRGALVHFFRVRGVGKTTAARILAKALNCVKGPTPEPCGECDACVEIAEGNSLDVIEIDAASNRGIDQIRELREMVRYAPAAARTKW